MPEKETDSYYTLSQPSSGIFKDRGSKFLAFAFPVTSVDQIKHHLNEIRLQHPSARHHCYAWRMGPENELSRASDDGEPSGSAGKPILNQIVVNNLQQILIVVVRYFGGTLLGVHGLVNAYKCAAHEAINNGKVVQKFVMINCRISFLTPHLNTVMRLIKEFGAKIILEEYTHEHVLHLTIRKLKAGELEERLSSMPALEFEILNN